MSDHNSTYELWKIMALGPEGQISRWQLLEGDCRRNAIASSTRAGG